MLRILFILACIWLFFVLFGKPLMRFLFGRAVKSAAANARSQNRQNSKPSSPAEQRPIIPDDVGSYVDFTEEKS